MNITDVLRDLAFICFFHAVGGIAIGFALRQMRQKISVSAIFFIIWGAIFGLAPIGSGIEIFQKAGLLFLVIVEVVVVVAAIAVTYFIGSDLVQDLQSKDVLMIMGGGVCLVMGLIAGIFVTQRNFLGGLFFFFLLGGAGVLFLVFGVRRLLGEK